ncbi:MAG: neutral/alkaline non-lysosomal ceramidase N-terminal domain-containing protein, partial [Planctomycetaceae bacterium]
MTSAMPFRRLFVITVFAAAMLWFRTPPAPASLQAGAARRSIAPPFPTHMGGFGDRNGTFEGVHDDLFVRALVLDDDKTQLVIIGSDLMAIDGNMVQLVRAGIEQQTKIPAGNILVSCAHNHSAPSYYQKERRGEKDIPLKDFLVDQFVKTAVEAFHNRVPALAGFKAGELRGATTNRQQGNDEVIDPQVGVLRVTRREDQQPIAILFNFTGHPVILGSKNLLLSGEYPGAAARAVESLLGGVAIFTQGACGDVTVHRSGDPYQEIERVGRTLAGEVIKRAGFIRGSEMLTLAAASRSLRLAPRFIPKLAQAQAALEKGQAA